MDYNIIDKCYFKGISRLSILIFYIIYIMISFRVEIWLRSTLKVLSDL